VKSSWADMCVTIKAPEFETRADVKPACQPLL
jgi:hypothetical protein